MSDTSSAELIAEARNLNPAPFDDPNWSETDWQISWNVLCGLVNDIADALEASERERINLTLELTHLRTTDARKAELAGEDVRGIMDVRLKNESSTDI